MSSPAFYIAAETPGNFQKVGDISVIVPQSQFELFKKTGISTDEFGNGRPKLVYGAREKSNIKLFSFSTKDGGYGKVQIIVHKDSKLPFSCVERI